MVDFAKLLDQSRAARNAREPAYDTADDFMTPEEVAEQRAEQAAKLARDKERVLTCALFRRALAELAEENRHFQSNLKVFERWDTEQRIWWINQIEQQAKDGKETVGVKVVARAIQLRLEQA